jgi:hypothetical protein
MHKSDEKLFEYKGRFIDETLSERLKASARYLFSHITVGVRQR